jgi:adenine deaminase
MDLAEFIEVARGDHQADLLLKNARIINVHSGEIHPGDVVVTDARIAAVDLAPEEGRSNYHAREVIDLKGSYLAPGFIDGHIHIESTMLRVPELARVVVPRGTTSIIADPHEIANVLGLDGIRYILESAKDGPLSVYVMLPSCVPATAMETAGAMLTAEDLRPLLDIRWVPGIGEMMNYLGVVNADPDVLAKVRIAGNKPVDGHAPGLSGRALNAYVAAGIGSDHECTTLSEAQEKLRLGMHIMIREGTTARNMEELIPLITPQNSRRCMLVSDDRHPDELMDLGHMDYSVRLAIQYGLDPIIAIQMVTCNPAEYFGLHHKGAIAPGYDADLVAFADLRALDVHTVIRHGRVVAHDGQLLPDAARYRFVAARGSMNVSWDYVDFRIVAQGRRARMIEIIPDQVVTECSIKEVKRVGNLAVPDPQRDILKLAVIERHLASGRMALGFVRGFGMKRGALASSVSHDSHNLIVVGAEDRDMMAAARVVGRMGGGFAVAVGGEMLAALPLPIAGLMSDQPVEVVREGIYRLLAAARELGATLPNPFMALSFLTLAVIPHLKLTDRGLVDVDNFQIVPLFVD